MGNETLRIYFPLRAKEAIGHTGENPVGRIRKQMKWGPSPAGNLALQSRFLGMA